MAFSPDIVCLGGAAGVAVVGGVLDLRTRRIPNWLTLPAIPTGILVRCWLGGWHMGLASSAGAALAFTLMVTLYAMRTMSGGDVKLMTAVGAFASLPLVFEELLWTALAGGVIAMAVILWKKQLRKRLKNVGLILLHHVHYGLAAHPQMNVDSADALNMPYGVAIAAGSLTVLILMRGTL